MQIVEQQMGGSSMNGFNRRIVGFALVLCITFPSYLMIVDVVNALGPRRFLKSLNVKGLRSNSADELVP
jgi:hypothetical protein